MTSRRPVWPSWMDSTYGYPADVWEAAERRMYATLEGVARKGNDLIAYSDLAAETGLPIPEGAPEWTRAHNWLLGQVSIRSWNEHDPGILLSALAVYKGSREPNLSGFKTVLEEVGLIGDPLILWAQQVKACYAAYR